MIVLDTHAWIWCNDDPGRLSAAAREAIDRAETVGIASVSCWEAGMLAVTGRVTFEPDVARWVRIALGRERVRALALSPRMALAAALLGDRGFVGDPADRLIYSTAVETGARLITRDARVREFDPRATLW